MLISLRKRREEKKKKSKRILAKFLITYSLPGTETASCSELGLLNLKSPSGTGEQSIKEVEELDSPEYLLRWLLILAFSNNVAVEELFGITFITLSSSTNFPSL